MTSPSLKPRRWIAERCLSSRLVAAFVLLSLADVEGAGRAVLFTAVPLGGTAAVASAQEILPLMTEWSSIAQRGPDKASELAALFTKDAAFTTFDEAVPLQGRSEIEDYLFSRFLDKKPILKFAPNAVSNCALSLGQDICTRSGSLSLRVLLDDPASGYDVKRAVTYAARATVVYQLSVNSTAAPPTRQWLIAEMHLSKERAKTKP